LVKKCILEKIKISPIPWASALLPAIISSWLSTHQFLYLWFLPVKKWRKTLLESLKNKKYTVIIYESVHRLLKTLNNLSEIFWEEHKICVAREITKKFEEFYRWDLDEAIKYFEKNNLKWEFVIIF